MRSFGWAMCLVVLVATAGSQPLSAAVIENGDFSVPGIPPDPFKHWTTDSFVGGRPTDGGGFAVFNVTDFIDGRHLEQTFTLPAGVRTLSFRVLLTTNPGGSAGPPGLEDSFQATLFDLDNDSYLFPVDPTPVWPPDDLEPTFPAFYSLHSSEVSPFEFYDSSYVTVTTDLQTGWKLVTLDLSSLASPRRLLIDFSQFGANDGLTSEIWLDNVRVDAVPEPASLTAWASLLLVGLCWARRRERSVTG